MNKLLCAGFRRYTRNTLFWLALLATIVCGILHGYHTKIAALEDTFIIAELIIIAVLFTWLIGREFDEGAFRNKVIVGHSKITIFLSELILGIGICLIFFVIYVAMFTAFNVYVFDLVPIKVLAKVFFSFLAASIGMTIIFVVISCLVSRRAIIAIINIILVIALIFCSYALDTSLREPEYYTEYEYQKTEITSENGSVISLDEPIPGSEHQVKNRMYLDGWKRTLAQTSYYVLPTGQIVNSVHLMEPYLGKERYERLLELGYDKNDDESILSIQKREQELEINFAYLPAMTLVVIFGGMILFRKKNFK